jgi:chromosome segregation ATPase
MLCEYLSNYAFISTVIQSLRDQIDEKEIDLNSNIELQTQMQTTIDDLTKKERANNQTIQELRQNQKNLQATIVRQVKNEKANNRTIQELLEKRNQLQATIADLTKTVDEMSRTVKLLLGQPEYVST